MRIDLDLAEEIIKEAKSTGADQAEVYYYWGRDLSVEIKSQQVDSLECATDRGYSIRVLKKGSVGFAYSNEPSRWKETLTRAIRMADLTDRDPFVCFAQMSEPVSVSIFDPEIERVTEETLIQGAMQMEKEALSHDKRIRKIRKARAGIGITEVGIVNSEGLRVSYVGTSAVADIVLAAEEDGESQMGWAFKGSRRISDIDFSATGREAAERALKLLGARRASTVKGEVLLESPVVSEILSVLAPAFSSDNVQKGKSMLAGKKGQRVFSERIDIWDDALLPWHLGTRPFDAEGVPSRRNLLVREGLLKEYLYNLYTARKEGTSSTASAIRGGIHTPPAVGISNLYITASRGEYIRTYQEMVKEIKKGLIVTEVMGVHTANPVTGEFSVGASGLWVEDGEIRHPVKEAAISGTIFELFQRVVWLGEKPRFYGKIGAPDMLFEAVDISG